MDTGPRQLVPIPAYLELTGAFVAHLKEVIRSESAFSLSIKQAK
jgi:hypothetical protein